MTVLDEIKTAFHNRRISAIHNTPLLFYTALDECSFTDYDFEICMRHLSLLDQQKILAQKRIQDRHVKLVNKLILPFVLEICDLQCHDEVQYKEHGKPYLPNVNFNISDEHDIVSIVIGSERHELGLDLANVHDCIRFNSQGTFLEDFKDIFTKDELDYLKDTKEQKELIYTHYWALKESYSKLLGTGLNESFQNFNFKDQVKLPLVYADLNANAEVMVKGLDKLDKVHWNQYNLNEATQNFTTMLTPNIVCSIFSARGPQAESVSVSAPTVLQFDIDILIRYYKERDCL